MQSMWTSWISNYSCKGKTGHFSSGSLLQTSSTSFFHVVAYVVFAATTQLVSSATCLW